MTHYERLLEQLPPNRRVEAALALENLSHDKDSPIFGLYAEILGGIEAKSQEREERLLKKIAESETREKQLSSQFAKGHAEHQSAIRREIQNLTKVEFWRRVLVSKIAAGITLAICWVGGSYWLINTQIDAVKNSVDQLKTSQTETLATIADNPQGIVDYANASLQAADKSNKTAAMLAGISALLATPDATIGMRDGKLTLKIRSEHVTIKEEKNHTYIRIHEEMPPIYGRIEDDLHDADKALQK